jgi:hypothetical protein
VSYCSTIDIEKNPYVFKINNNNVVPTRIQAVSCKRMNGHVSQFHVIFPSPASTTLSKVVPYFTAIFHVTKEIKWQHYCNACSTE